MNENKKQPSKRGIETFGPDRMFQIIESNSVNWNMPWAIAQPIVKELINQMYSVGFAFSYIHDDDTMELLKNSWIGKKPIFFAMSADTIKRFKEAQKLDMMAADPKIAAAQQSIGQLLGDLASGNANSGSSNAGTSTGGEASSTSGTGQLQRHADGSCNQEGNTTPTGAGADGAVRDSGQPDSQSVQSKGVAIATPPPQQ